MYVAQLGSDEKKLRSALSKEILYRKYSTKNIKFDNPLFRQQKCETKVMIGNPKLLLMTTDVPMVARYEINLICIVIGPPRSGKGTYKFMLVS